MFLRWKYDGANLMSMLRLFVTVSLASTTPMLTCPENCCIVSLNSPVMSARLSTSPQCSERSGMCIVPT